MRNHPSIHAISFAVLLAAGAQAAAPAHALTASEFAEARGRYELSDGRTVYLGGTARRTRLEIGDDAPLWLTGEREGHLVSPDGRVELQLIVLDNGVVSALRLTQRR
jgi:hypothetical protein